MNSNTSHWKLFSQGNKKKKIKREKTLKGIIKSHQVNNISIVGVSEGEEGNKRPETISKEIMTEHLLNLGKKTDIHIQETQRASKYDEPKEIHTNTYDNQIIKS